MVIKAEESNKSETGSLITKRHTHTHTHYQTQSQSRIQHHSSNLYRAELNIRIVEMSTPILTAAYVVSQCLD